MIRLKKFGTDQLWKNIIVLLCDFDFFPPSFFFIPFSARISYNFLFFAVLFSVIASRVPYNISLNNTVDYIDNA